MKNNKQPEIRFSGFHEEWEQHKLEDGISQIGDGIHGTPNYIDNGDIAFINGNNLVNGKIIVSSETKMVNSSQLTNAEKNLDSNTILMSINGTIGNLAWYRNEKIMLGKSSAYLKVSDFNKEFVFVLLQTSKIKSYFFQNLTGTTIKNLGLKTIRETPALLPVLDEQVRIGNLFKQLDDTIALHQQELTTLKKTKQGFLQKMFPKEGEKVPAIRFPEFTDDWEPCKFADLFNRVKSYSLSRDVETKEETEVRYIHYGDIHTKVADKINNQSKIPNINQGNFETLQQGDLILADASEDYQGIATPAVILESTHFDIVAGLHTIVLRPKDANPLYLYYLINSEVFRKYGYRVGTGMKVFGISATNVLKFETLFPSYDEQKKIGTFFKQLDDTVALHQRELELLKETKKAFLQKMFV